MKKVLFVDDEPNVLSGIRRMLHPMRGEWMMAFASNGGEAAQLLAESEFDVLVTDVRMPGVNGIELLTETMRQHPRVVRIVLSGTADQEVTLRSVSLAHQYLMKPCDAETLRQTLENALDLRNILDDPCLTALMGRIPALPSIPAVYLRLMEALKAEGTSANDVGEIIAQDLGMSAKVLQWVNSPLFGCARTVASPQDAVIYLGTETVKALVLTESVFSQFDAKSTPGFSVEALRKHSADVATMAQWIARSHHLPQTVINNVTLGGLLHDIGKLVLGCNFPGKYRKVVDCFEDPTASRERELEIFGTTHAEVGAYLLWLWGLPKGVTEIVVRHHTAGPETSEVRDPAGVVNLADALVREGGSEASNPGSEVPSREVTI